MQMITLFVAALSAASTGAGFRCNAPMDMSGQIATVETVLAGVPAILRIPRNVTQAPIVLWHGFGPPASERALMEALPLDDVPAVKVYLGLPLFGERAPPGGNSELGRRQQQDFAMQLFKPSVVGAAEELPAVIAGLRARACMGPHDRIGLFGFSAGGASVLVALMAHAVDVRSAVVLNASTGLSASVAALEQATKKGYSWTPAARALAERTDAIRHAAEIARDEPPTALLILQGADDNVLASQPAAALREALQPYYHAEHADRLLRLDVIPGVTHAWAEDSASTDVVRRRIASWFLGG